MADDQKAEEGQPRSILVLISEAYERNHTSMLLQRFGYHVYTADTAKETAKFLSVALPRLIVAETRLASAAGFDLLTAMKQNPRTAAVPVILVSPSLDAAAVKRFRDSGYAAVLGLPLNADELYRAVQAAIEPYPRQSIRVAASVMANVGDNPAGFTRHSLILSENGMFVLTTAPQPVRTRLPVSLVIKDRTIKTETVVLYSHGMDDYPLKEPGMGLRFEVIGPEDKAVLRSFIQELVEKGFAGRR